MRGLATAEKVMSTSPELPGVFASLAPLLDSYGYLAVGGMLLAENAGVPLPGETILIAASVYAGAGQLNIAVVGIIGFLACVVGDNAAYVIGRVGGRRAVLRYGRYILLTEERLRVAELFFERHGGKVVTVARFIAGLRQANGLLAGITGMSWKRFVVFNALGALIWVTTWCTVGYVAGNHIDTVYDTVERYSIIAGIVLGVAVVALVMRHLARRRREQRLVAALPPADTPDR